MAWCWALVLLLLASHGISLVPTFLFKSQHVQLRRAQIILGMGGSPPKPVEQLDPVSGKVIRSFKSILEASRQTGIPVSNISRAVSGKYRHAGKYLWRRQGDKAIPELFESAPTPSKVPIEQLDPLTGKVIESFKSIKEASRKTNISDASIHRALNGKYRHAGGYLWRRRLGDTRSPCLFDKPIERWSTAKRRVEKVDPINGEIVGTYESMSEASRQNDLVVSAIRYVVEGQSNHAGGFHWREAGNSTGMETLPSTTRAQKRLAQGRLFGDDIERQAIEVASCIRIYFQNINGISSLRNFLSWKSMLRKLKKQEVDIIMLSETNLDWRSIAYDECEKHAKIMLGEVLFSVSSSIHRAGNGTVFQPGGTVTLLDNKKHMSTTTASGGDHLLGRWSWILIKNINGQSIIFVTAYQPHVYLRLSKTKSFSVLAQHYAILDEQKRKVHPRAAFIQDIRIQLAAWRKQGHEIVLAGDFNENLNDYNSGIGSIAQEFGLRDAYHICHEDKPEPETHFQGSKRIDYVFVTPGLVDSIDACGILPYAKVIKSDHRPIFVDFRTDKLFGASADSDNKK